MENNNTISIIEAGEDKNAKLKRQRREYLNSLERKRAPSGAWQYKVGKKWLFESDAIEHANKKFSKKARKRNDDRSNRTSRHTKPLDPVIARRLIHTFRRTDTFVPRSYIEKLKISDQEKREYVKNKLTTKFRDEKNIVGGKGGMFAPFVGVAFDEAGNFTFKSQRGGGDGSGVVNLTPAELVKAINYTVNALPNQTLNFVNFVSKIAEGVFKDSFYHSSFNGKRWAPLAESTIEKRKKRGTWGGAKYRILRESGALYNAIKTIDGKLEGTKVEGGVGLNPQSIRANGKSVDEDYGALHMTGTSHMPARPFMGFSNAITKEANFYSRVFFVHGALW